MQVASAQSSTPRTIAVKRDYRCLFFKLEPQMKDLGEATPDVVTILGWLGVKKRETIIAAVHAGLIDNLEKSLDSIAKILENRKRVQRQLQEMQKEPHAVR
mmetsp:Transcript_15847/g.24657  ORF Transcript_15847/g.24657 Transcript_15847/m.24657 type:complete len:101 (+) Transcript_15847:587-889(+)